MFEIQVLVSPVDGFDGVIARYVNGLFVVSN